MKKIWKWTKRIGFGIVGTLIAIAITGALYQSFSATRDEKQYPPVGEMVDIGGYRLHLVSEGEGGPTVVFDGGLGCGSLHWSLVQPEVARFTRTVAIDRAGNGWSDESPLDRTSDNIVTEMHAVLHKANILGPYILVGHSFGGLNVQLFASKYPDEVAGVILVDSCHEDMVEKMKTLEIPEEAVNEPLMMLSARLGLLRIGNYFQKKSIAMFPEETRDQMLAIGSTAKFMRTALREWKKLQVSCDQLKQAERCLEDKPLTVLSAGKMDTSGARLTQEQINQGILLVQELQRAIATKSNRSKQIIVESDHLIPWHAPQSIVNAIREQVEQFRDFKEHQ
jgi:pimeloyl-ACP methyl ester carboxylesterase